ncbi:sporulation protein YqfD [Sporosarcina sp. HYO08]|uniref:sporulation protein YqfD n=1 Tax=Sporosarcina sp. HYO08 TaxID=1759557 RepID=UPI00155DF90F|nr:sporulation protein YqfD [Sporosarcina sp. HYO08]
MNKRYEVKVWGKGDLSAFLTTLVSNKTKILSLAVDDGKASFRTDRSGLRNVRKFRRRYRLKVAISLLDKGLGPNWFFASPRFLIACLLPLVGSFFLWKVEVDTDRPEVAERIETKLQSSSIVPLKLLSTLPDEGEIRQMLMLEDPTLSWVRFRRVGTSLTVIPMLSPPANQNIAKKGPPSDLVARTGGVITRFELKSGERVGYVHQTVKKGDVLATGVLKQGDKTTIVGADGAVFADYWVEYSFSIPKLIDYRQQGEEIIHYSFQLPWKKEAGTENAEGETDGFWPLVKKERYIKEVGGSLELKKGMEKTVIIPLLKNKLLSEPSSKSIIKDEKILHVTFGSDKVSGTILFLMNDNIAVKRPISQGDEDNG